MQTREKLISDISSQLENLQLFYTAIKQNAPKVYKGGNNGYHGEISLYHVNEAQESLNVFFTDLAVLNIMLDNSLKADLDEMKVAFAKARLKIDVNVPDISATVQNAMQIIQQNGFRLFEILEIAKHLASRKISELTSENKQIDLAKQVAELTTTVAELTARVAKLEAQPQQTNSVPATSATLKLF